MKSDGSVLKVGNLASLIAVCKNMFMIVVAPGSQSDTFSKAKEHDMTYAKTLLETLVQW